MMKRFMKFLAPMLALALLLTACGGNGGSGGAEAPDLTKYYEDYMASLGEGNTPMMMDMTEDEGLMGTYYPGLTDVETKQLVVRMPAITGQAFEFALAEAADADGAKTIADIFQARIDSQLSDSMMYPGTLDAWEAAKVITHGNVVALIVAGEGMEDAVPTFEALFK